MSDIIENDVKISKMNLARKLLAKAESTDSGPESDALFERAASLMADYGIDRAMLDAQGTSADEIVDKVIMIARPFADKYRELLWRIAIPMRAKARSIKTWNPQSGPKRAGGIPAGGWDYGLRIFAFQSDMERIELIYTLARRQAEVGVSKVRGYEKFGQDKKAHRDSYLSGYSSAIYWKVQQAEEQAAKIQATKDREAADLALLEGGGSKSFALVVVDRETKLNAAIDLANGITPAKRAEINARHARQTDQWAEMDRKALERHNARVAEQAACPKCQKAKSGYCADHRDMKPVSFRPAYQPKGAYFGTGYQDGERADLGLTAPQLSQEDTVVAIESTR